MSFATDVLCAPNSPLAPALPGQRERLHSTAEIHRIMAAVVDKMRTAGYLEQDIFGVRVGLEEAIANAIKHGHQEDPTKEVQVAFTVSPDQVLIQVEDQGPGFDPEQIPDPLADENLERPSGRGVLLMRSYLTWIHYNPRGNCVTLCKRRSA